jgi:membrane protease YdiL (CAAX protease family)
MTCFWEEVAPGFAELLEAPWSGGEILASFTVGPLLEEVVFRGFLLCAWTHRLGLRRAVLLSSALFGLLHPQEPLGAFAAGVVLCALRVRYGTLWVPVTFHSLFNLSAVLLGSGLDASPWAAYLETFVRSNLPMLATVGGLGVAATLLYSLRLMAGRALFEGGAPARRPG